LQTTFEENPVRLKSVLALCRVSNLPTVWMNVITAALLVSYATQQPVAWLMVVGLAIAISAFYCAGMSLNDVCDYQWDKEHQPYRPLVAGKLSLQQAKVITAVLFIVGFALLSLAPFFAGVFAGLALFIVIVAYNVLHKKHASSVLLMAGARTLVFVVVAQALTSEFVGLAMLAGAVQFLYTLSLTLVARHENKRGKPYAGPVIPRMIAAMALVDGVLLAVVISPVWLLLGIVMTVLTRFSQRYVRGD